MQPLRNNYNTVWEAHPGSQEAYLSCPAWEALIEGNRGGGKAQPLDCDVVTPFGIRQMRDMKVGSLVSNPDGSTSKVIGIYPQGKQDTYRVTFSDGSSTKCCGDHLWFAKVANRNKMKRDADLNPLKFPGKIFTTKQLKDIMETVGKKPLVPCPEPVDFHGVKVTHKRWVKYTFDPYLLGLLLGDGSLSRKVLAFDTADDELAEYVEAHGFYTTRKEKSGSSCYRVKANHPIYKNLERSKLRGTKSDTKFIPDRYKYGSVEERLAVVQGLMDTDGEANDGKAYYSSVSRRLIEDLRFVIQSLGGWATIIGGRRGNQLRYKKDGEYVETKRGWGLYIRFPSQKELFRLERKRAKASNYMHGHLVRKIVSIELIGREKVQCIKVDNPNGLYMTDDFIVTHNTDALLFDYLQHVGMGYGQEWRGILFREEYTQLTDVINKSLKWIPQIFPGAKFNGSEHKWTFPEGETLYLRYMRVPADYWNYHGHEYPWVGWEELTNWATDECYIAMMSCNRSSHPDVPRKYRGTCNPSGKGHGWVKARFITAIDPFHIITDKVTGRTRARIQSRLDENKALLEADPHYETTIIAAAGASEAKQKAWIKGSWDIIVGGYFYEVWEPDLQVLPYFRLPSSWYVLRSFDWGSKRPWAVSYIAECNGEQPDQEEIDRFDLPYFPKGSAVVFDELYGWNGTDPDVGDEAKSSQIAKKVKKKDEQILKKHGIKVKPGPADIQIYEVRDGKSIAQEMSRLRVTWRKAYKGPGSRVAGWDLMGNMLLASKEEDFEAAQLYFTKRARHHIRTLPEMQTDEKNIEDIDSDLEDHAMDSVRYGLTRKFLAMKRKKVNM